MRERKKKIRKARAKKARSYRERFIHRCFHEWRDGENSRLKTSRLYRIQHTSLLFCTCKYNEEKEIRGTHIQLASVLSCVPPSNLNVIYS